MLSNSPIAIPIRILSQKLEDETVLLDIETGRYFGLTPVASRAWELLQQGRTPTEVLAGLAAEFDAPRETIAADLEELLQQLEQKRLVAS